ncbi:hypothetical protein BOW53_06440 [Solemya pervernicosa gill symbiont]|uniref:DUF4426 domain-containing protein n=3 Tax=Gammaproteobacteria incertae sedis TaxID=118884 RepID=A0A1T2L6R8_9GAMM|nr:hypothetical protein [Candidatus Reidiella endopervernicosa]OOZ40752.1 hypothetical protein BOW53_06440 [Solemya pervernicosa gill symbiont]QKQ26418.1 hypothetical protein HUE57_09080 [Candidatus Reidiella endopervernicosa]
MTIRPLALSLFLLSLFVLSVQAAKILELDGAYGIHFGPLAGSGVVVLEEVAMGVDHMPGTRLIEVVPPQPIYYFEHYFLNIDHKDDSIARITAKGDYESMAACMIVMGQLTTEMSRKHGEFTENQVENNTNRTIRRVLRRSLNFGNVQVEMSCNDTREPQRFLLNLSYQRHTR